MDSLGFDEGIVRFSSFALIFLVMSALETWLPRRQRRESRLRRWSTNLGILATDFVTVWLVTFLIPVTAVLAAFWAGGNGIGAFNLFGWPWWLEWGIAFVVLDFVIWTQHVVFHKIPTLWRVHRVHHADHDIDASTGVRFHPVEILISMFVKAAAVVALGADPVLVVIFEATVNGSALFNHANLKLPARADRVLRTLVVTPDMHRVHHSADRKETDTNYGFFLSVWDRSFRLYTAQPEKGHDAMTIGLDGYQGEGPEQLGWSLALPFQGRDRVSRS